MIGNARTPAGRGTRGGAEVGTLDLRECLRAPARAKSRGGDYVYGNPAGEESPATGV